jgi:SSS family solute:Na+ symporter
VSLITPKQKEGSDLIRVDDVSYRTPLGFNAGALGVIAILVALYALYW